jgi:hypothetical protein
MSVPNVLLIDTSVLDEQNYNFASSALAAFCHAVEEREITLLLPDPIEREVKRHIQSKSEEVVKALQEAKRRAPFLSKWKAWPGKEGDARILSEVSKLANEEWEDFLSKFEVQRLGYEGIDVTQVMDWYDRSQAPFGTGKKRKEFPDAFTLAAVLHYAKRRHISVAIISRDSDFESACKSYAELSYYSNLPSVTEAFIAGDKRVEEVKALLTANPGLMEESLKEDFKWLTFSPEQEPSGDVEDVEVDELELDDFRVVSLGNTEFSVAFLARIRFSAFVFYGEPETPIAHWSDVASTRIRERRGRVHDWAEVTGIAKIRVSDSWDRIEEVSLLSLDDKVIVVREKPPLAD